MTPAAEVTLAPLTADRWQHAVTVFGTRGDPSRCWCQWFRMRNADWRRVTTAGNRQALRARLHDAVPPGVLGYLDGVPSGWCSVAPRAGLPRLAASTALRAARVGEPDDPAVWSVTCFVVVPGTRRHGLTGPLGYPVDVAAAGSPSSSLLYHGTLSTFLAAGFSQTGRTSASRPVVSLDLTAPGPVSEGTTSA
jgi:hypothetical protein